MVDFPLARKSRPCHPLSVSQHWREEVAQQLALAAEELRLRRDGSFSRSFTVAMGYLDQAAHSGTSRNAERVWQAVRRAVNESESTAQMKLTPEAMENLLRIRAQGPEVAPPSLPSNEPPRRPKPGSPEGEE
jgi:hypothetical protein